MGVRLPQTMLGYLKGKIILKADDFVILDVKGVGYKVFVSKKSNEKIEENGQEKLFVFLFLARTTIELYGFLNFEELKLFEILERISGIGPKTALSLASFGSLVKLKQAIEKDDKKLEEIKGIGEKRIQRLMIEISGELKKSPKQKISQEDDVLQGLIFLGFSRKNAETALSKMSKEIKEPKERIKEALKMLGS